MSKFIGAINKFVSGAYESSIANNSAPDGNYMVIFAEWRQDQLTFGRPIIKGLTAHWGMNFYAAADTIQIIASNAAGVVQKSFYSTSTMTDQFFHRIIAYVDTTDINNCFLIFDGVEDVLTGIVDGGTDPIDLTDNYYIAQSSSGVNYNDCGIKIIGMAGVQLTRSQALSFFTSDGYFTDMGPDGSYWFGSPASILHRGKSETFNINKGIGPNADVRRGNGAVFRGFEQRQPVDQADNYLYKAANDITVSSTTKTITSTGLGFRISSDARPEALKIGDYIHVTGSTGKYQLTAVAAGSLTVSDPNNTLQDYAPSADEYACVFRVGRRPV